MVLEKIQKANDIKKLKPEELEVLAQEIRDFLIEKISVTGGHLASNLGVVELTMAMHLILTCRRIRLSGMWGIKRIRTNCLPAEKPGLMICGNMVG